MKRCFYCSIEKEISGFVVYSTGKVGRICRKCWLVKHSASSKKYSSNHPQRRAASRLKWNDKNRKRIAEKSSIWAKKNREKCAVYWANYYALKSAAIPKWANRFFIEEIYDLARRRTKITGFPWHVDHIVPIKSHLVCGLHVENNLQVIPMTVNVRKKNRFWPEMPA